MSFTEATGLADSLCPAAPEAGSHPDAEGTPFEDWVLWQLLDSAFPTGGFAHSGGLEAAWQHGEVGTRHELAGFLDAALIQAGHGALPLVLATHREPGRLEELDSLCHDFTTNHVANRASRLQGRAFLTAAQRIFPAVNLSGAHASQAVLPHSHFAPIFGSVLRRLGVGEVATASAFLFSHLRGLLASAVRLNIIGPMEAQVLQF